ncbi:Mu-like prophage protein gpG [Solimonas aquatica]|uniref:Mu-like prophage protein gpG n=1 Tax=Solimonas aquatica TaxID=489703 RepID=A0A1H9FRV5_9GAMM|nr:phage virion morphogenesis protein [Solimonas aquatica]SEQ40624.1 Mu-like prophage protein gpG [Solimonas aquatica]
MKIDIETNFPAVHAAFLDLAHRAADMTPAMEQLAHLLLDESEDAFARQRSPNSGDSWPTLAATTIRERAELGYWPGKMLQRTGHLAASLVPDHGPDFAAVGTNLDYAAVMFFGAERGEFGSTSKGAPIPWGDIPGREYMGLSAEREPDALDIVGDYLLRLPPT